MPAKTYKADWLDQTSTEIDLRKKLSERRVDTITERADWLVPEEQSLVLAVFRDGYSASEIARLQSEDPRFVRRKIKRALRRLHDPSFLFAMRHLSDFSPTRRRVAKSIFRSGRSIRETAELLDLSLHHVRRHRNGILDMIDSDIAPDTSPTQSAIDRSWR